VVNLVKKTMPIMVLVGMVVGLFGTTAANAAPKTPKSPKSFFSDCVDSVSAPFRTNDEPGFPPEVNVTGTLNCDVNYATDNLHMGLWEQNDFGTWTLIGTSDSGFSAESANDAFSTAVESPLICGTHRYFGHLTGNVHAPFPGPSTPIHPQTSSIVAFTRTFACP
jgi:hypothetical protein